MRRARHVSPLVLTAVAATLVATAGRASDQMTRQQMEVISWISDVRRHQPGALDEHAKNIAAISWTTLRPILEDVQRQRDPELLLLGATTLLDIAVHIPLNQRPHRTDLGMATVAQDGEKRGVVSLDTHLHYARRLVDRAIDDHRALHYHEMRPHAMAWYRTVSAILAGASNLADLQPHIKRSLEMFPDEPGILFDAGCYAETFASPMMQAAISTRQEVPSRIKVFDLLHAATKNRNSLLEEAERRFRRAVELDPSAVEAHVRLARVLTLRGHPAQAADDLRRVVRMPATAVVSYYASLFLGNALERLGEFNGAAEAYTAAVRLFPKAQSPLFALSRLAADRNEPPVAREMLERALALPEPDRFDPWWFYHRGSGIDSESAYRQFASRMAKLSGGPKNPAARFH